MRDWLFAHKQYTRQQGDDMPEVREWKWSPAESAAGGEPEQAG